MDQDLDQSILTEPAQVLGEAAKTMYCLPVPVCRFRPCLKHFDALSRANQSNYD